MITFLEDVQGKVDENELVVEKFEVILLKILFKLLIDILKS
jgi:hypothetical protein